MDIDEIRLALLALAVDAGYADPIRGAQSSEYYLDTGHHIEDDFEDEDEDGTGGDDQPDAQDFADSFDYMWQCANAVGPWGLK